MDKSWRCLNSILGVISELFYGYIDINCLNKFEVENECKLATSTAFYLWQLEGANVSALYLNILRQALIKKKKKHIGYAVVVQWSKLALKMDCCIQRVYNSRRESENLYILACSFSFIDIVLVSN